MLGLFWTREEGRLAEPMLSRLRVSAWLTSLIKLQYHRNMRTERLPKQTRPKQKPYPLPKEGLIPPKRVWKKTSRNSYPVLQERIMKG